MTQIDESTTLDVALRQLMLETAEAMVARRVYPVQLPDDVQLPALVYSVVSDVPGYVNGNDSGFRRVRLQVDAFGGSLRDARRADESARARLSGFDGRVHGVGMAIWRLNTYPVFYEAEGLWRVVSDYAVSVVC